MAPNDPAIGQALKNLAAQQTMDEQGYEKIEQGEGSYRDILRDKTQAAALEQEQRQVKTGDVASELIREYRARLETEPNNKKLLQQIAELHTQRKEYDEALACYGMITTIEGGDPSLERAVSEVRMKKMELRIEQLDPSDPEYAAARAALEKELQDFEIAEARRRLEKQPNDLGYRYELAELYFRAGRIGEAIPEFQRAKVNPNKRTRAHYYLGLCWAGRGMHDLAVKDLQTALTDKEVFDDEKKEILYALGEVLEKSGKRAEAIEQFKQIYAVDINYRDVAPRVEAHYANAG